MSGGGGAFGHRPRAGRPRRAPALRLDGERRRPARTAVRLRAALRELHPGLPRSQPLVPALPAAPRRLRGGHQRAHRGGRDPLGAVPGGLAGARPGRPARVGRRGHDGLVLHGARDGGVPPLRHAAHPHVRRDARSARPLRDDGGHRDLRARLLRAHRPAGRGAVPAHRRGAALLRPVPPRSGDRLVDRRRRPLRDRRAHPRAAAARARAGRGGVRDVHGEERPPARVRVGGHGRCGAAPTRAERAAGGRARRERAAAARRRAGRRASRRWPDGRAARRAEGGAGRAPVPDVALGARRRPAHEAARLPAAVDPGHHGLRRPHDLRAGLPAARATRPSGRSTGTPPGSRATTGCSSPTPPRWISTARSAGARGRPCTSSAGAGTPSFSGGAWRRSSRSPSATPARWCATG